MPDFRSFMQQMMAQGGGEPGMGAAGAPTPMPTPTGTPMPFEDGSLPGMRPEPNGRPSMGGMPSPGPTPSGTPGQDSPMLLLLMLAMAMEQMQQGGPDRSSAGPDGGDLYDSNNEMGGNPLQGLFGQPPVPLRQPPPGVSRRRGF